MLLNPHVLPPFPRHPWSAGLAVGVRGPPPPAPTLVLSPAGVELTFRTVLLSEDGVRPDHKANLQGSPSTCSVTPSSEVCRQEMPVRGGRGGQRGNSGLGWERQQRGGAEEGASVNQTQTGWAFCSSTWKERTHRLAPD